MVWHLVCASLDDVLCQVQQKLYIGQVVLEQTIRGCQDDLKKKL